MKYLTGALVKARNREWVVLPQSTETFLYLRPLGGSENEVAGVHTLLEKVEHAEFALPDPQKAGDFVSSRLLFDAVRLGFRSSAGPFRCFSKLSFEPRPYQLVPLLIALGQDPVRILIADDVGIGKTIEALIIAKELIDRGEHSKLAVICPPHLTDQWQREMHDKFHLNAESVTASSASKLERQCMVGESVFDKYPVTVVSIDYIKSDRRREEFIRSCPDLVIVDEAHTCAFGGRGFNSHQRNALINALSQKQDRSIILVTATPHSGKEDAFRSLLGLLKPEFNNLPDDLTGPDKVNLREDVSKYFIQRRRGDIISYLDETTPFPKRTEPVDKIYKLHPEYKKLFSDAIAYSREIVADESGSHFVKRLRWWSVLALLRSLASSPSAACATLLNRAKVSEEEKESLIDEMGRSMVMDLDEVESGEYSDNITGFEIEGETKLFSDKNSQKLILMAKQAEKLKGSKDNKLKEIVLAVKELLVDKCNPILFCRFIPTAKYVSEELKKTLPNKIEVVCITGEDSPPEREQRISEIDLTKQRVLVCTDCLSEGINLQEYFDTVIHYDLSWNPTRHEQREGRVDRFGQKKSNIRIVNYYSSDNHIDGIILEILLKKHQTIKNSLGISVPLPVKAETIVEAVLQSLLMKKTEESLEGMQLSLFRDPEAINMKKGLEQKWEIVEVREKRSMTMFSQMSIKVEEVKRQIQNIRAQTGSVKTIESFFIESLKRNGAVISLQNDLWIADIIGLNSALKDYMGVSDKKELRFYFNINSSAEGLYLTRTHPLVESLASYILDESMSDSKNVPSASRCGVIKTSSVSKKTVLFFLRSRFDIEIKKAGKESVLLAEKADIAGFTMTPEGLVWLDREKCESLSRAIPDENIHPEQATRLLNNVIENWSDYQSDIRKIVEDQAEEVLKEHNAVREQLLKKGHTGMKNNVKPKIPPDILGIYILMPVAGGVK